MINSRALYKSHCITLKEGFLGVFICCIRSLDVILDSAPVQYIRMLISAIKFWCFQEKALKWHRCYTRSTSTHCIIYLPPDKYRQPL